MMNRRMIAAAALLMATTLGGCSRSEPEDAPIETNEALDAVPAPAPDAPPPVLSTGSSLPEATTNIVTPPPAEPVEPDAQMIDDADATGMTARLPRQDDAPAPDNDGDSAEPDDPPKN